MAVYYDTLEQVSLVHRYQQLQFVSDIRDLISASSFLGCKGPENGSNYLHCRCV